MGLVTNQSPHLGYNAGAFVSQGAACLVDPGITAEDTAELVEKIGRAEVRYIVLTHADWDHVLGPEHLPGVTIVAHTAFAEEIDREGIRAALARLEQHAGIAREALFEPPLPDETFDVAMTLRVGRLELRLEHAPGHSSSMLTIYEPESATLWAADVLSDVEIPSIVDDLGRYERTLERLALLDIRTLVPGHGTPTEDPDEIRRRLDEDRKYLSALRGTIAESVRAGRSLEEALAAAARISLRRSADDEELHRLNSEKAYADLGGDADPHEVGYARTWKELAGT